MKSSKTAAAKPAPSKPRPPRAALPPNRPMKAEGMDYALARSDADLQPEVVLLGVTGMSPAVLTETIWALAHPRDGSKPVVPHRVLAVTTTQGRTEIVRQLLDPCARFGGLAPWDVLREALASEGLPVHGRLRFGATANDIRVITATDPASGRSAELADLRTVGDNDAAADYLLEQVRGVVENPDTRLIASMAGGRKTMGALLYACLTLAGRETDRLTHVLVNEPFETLREFCFPGQPGGELMDRAGRAHDPAQALVELADVPFVPLRNLFVRELSRKAGTFSRLIASCRDNVRQRAAESLRLTIETARPELEVNGTRIKLAPLEHLLLLFLARRAKGRSHAFGSYKDALDALNEARTEMTADVPKGGRGDWRDSWRDSWDERSITKATADLRAKLRGRGADAAALASCLPEKGRCSLDMPGEMIFIQ